MNLFPTTILLLVFAIAAAVLSLVSFTFVRLVRARVRIHQSLERDGYRVRRLEARFFTRGPFSEMRALPGTKHGDRLYRVYADDRDGRQCVLWVRLPAAMPWQALRWDVRRDEETNRSAAGIGALVFYGMIVGLVAGILLIAWRTPLAAQTPSGETRTAVQIFLTVEPQGAAAPATRNPFDTIMTVPGLPVTIRGVVARELAGAAVRITVTPSSRQPAMLSATVSQNAGFEIAYVPRDTGLYSVGASDASGRFHGTTVFTVHSAAGADEDIPTEQIAEAAVELTKVVCQATDALVPRIAELPASPARDELKRRLEELQRDGKEALPCDEAPEWVNGIDHLNNLRHIAPEIRPAIAPVVLRFKAWLDVVDRARHDAPQALAQITQGNVVCDQLDIVVNGLKFADFYLGLVTTPSAFLKDWATENVPTKLVGMVPAIKRTPAVKEGIELGWKGVTSYKPVRGDSKVKISTKGVDLALAHTKMLNATLQYAGSRVLEAYCERFQGPISGSMTAEFNRGPRLWWSYTITISGQLILRYPKNAKGDAVALTGEFMGNATKFESWDNAIPVLFGGLGESVIYKTFRLEPLSMSGFSHFLSPNLGLTPTSLADFNPITSIIDKGGPIVQNILTPAFFRVPVHGDLRDKQLRLELGEAATDFDDARVKVIRIMAPVLSLLPEVASYALPYKGARFILSRAMNDAQAELTVTRSGETMVVEQTFNRDRTSGEAKGVYKLNLKACNPGC